MRVLKRHARSIPLVYLNARDSYHGTSDREQGQKHLREMAGGLHWALTAVSELTYSLMCVDMATALLQAFPS